MKKYVKKVWLGLVAKFSGSPTSGISGIKASGSPTSGEGGDLGTFWGKISQSLIPEKFTRMVRKNQNKISKLGWRVISTIVLTLTAVSTFVAYAAFNEPTAAPSASNQDFSQNILGADNVDNAFDSVGVVANEDGSIVEVLEYIQSQL